MKDGSKSELLAHLRLEYKRAININRWVYISICLISSICSAAEVDPGDLLQGKGSFQSHESVATLQESWQLLSTDYSVSLADESLILGKPDTGKHNFDDGVLIRFNETQPQHLSFWCKTDNENLESCDVRLFKRNETDIEKMVS